MAEAHSPVLDVDESRVLGRLESVRVEAESRERTSYDVQAVDCGDRQQEHCALGAARQALRAAGEGSLDAGSGRERVLERLDPEQLPAGQDLGELDQGERVAVGRSVQPIHHLGRNRVPDLVLDDAACGLALERA